MRLRSVMAASALFALAVLLLGGFCCAVSTDAAFSLEFFEADRLFALTKVAFSGDARAAAAGIALTSPRAASAGRAAYKEPVTFVGRKPGFSTYFSFSFADAAGEAGVDGSGPTLAFVVAPSGSNVASDASPLGLQPTVVAVGFLVGETSKKHYLIEIDSSGERITRSIRGVTDGVADEKLHAWIDYNGTANKMDVRLGRTRAPRPSNPVVSYPIDLSRILWQKPMIVGFRAATRNSSRNCSLYSWAFATNHGSPYRMHSQPIDPSELLGPPNQPPLTAARSGMKCSWKLVLGVVFAAACGAMAVFFLKFMRSTVFGCRRLVPAECPVHPSDVVYEKIVMVGAKDDGYAINM